MKTWFQQLPIRHKLNTIILLACSVALLLTTAVSFVSQRYLIQKQLRGELQTLSSVIAENSRAGLAFHDRATLKTILASLANKPSVIHAGIYSVEGKLFADYRNTTTVVNRPPDISETNLRDRIFRVHTNHVDVVQPIVLDGEQIGALYIQVSLSEARRNLLLIGGGYGWNHGTRYAGGHAVIHQAAWLHCRSHYHPFRCNETALQEKTI